MREEEIVPEVGDDKWVRGVSERREESDLTSGAGLSVAMGLGGLPLRERLEWAGAERWPGPLHSPLGLLSYFFCSANFPFSNFLFIQYLLQKCFKILQTNF
jgi:hypothetical protein